MELPDDDSTKSRCKLHPPIVELGRCGVVSLSPSVDRVIDDDALFKLVKKAPAASLDPVVVSQGRNGEKKGASNSSEEQEQEEHFSSSRLSKDG